MRKPALPNRYFPIVLVILFILLILCCGPTWAAPGGLIKAAAKSFWVKMFLLALFVFFAPLIILESIKKRRMLKKTAKALQQASQIAPHFEWLPLKERIKSIFLWVHDAWDQRKMELAVDYMTTHYRQNQQLLLDQLERKGLTNVTGKVKLKEITPILVQCNPATPNKDRIVVEIKAEMQDYLIDKDGNVIDGDKTVGDLTTVWSMTYQNGDWLLNNIEESKTIGSYLEMPDSVAEPVPTTNV